MTSATLATTLATLTDVRVGVIGDFALDVYFELNKDSGEISIETNKPVFYGAALATSPGGASNVVNNLHALGVKDLHVFGATGDDMLGHELHRLFLGKGVNAESFYVDTELASCAYVKPFAAAEEASRIDFGTDSGPSVALKDRILKALSLKVQDLDVVIVNQQFIYPFLDAASIAKLNVIIADNPHCYFCADIRENGDQLKGATLKINASEAAKLLGVESFDERDTTLCMENVRQLSTKTGAPVLLTLGDNGLIYADAGTASCVPGIYLTGELDTVGAGDSVISAFASCIGGSIAIADALQVANAAAAVTVRKLRQAGTASADEIIATLEGCSHNYNLDLANDARKASYVDGTDIELVEEFPADLNIQVAIVDHDGTISTLREGWEKVMLPVMMESICGSQLQNLSTGVLDKLTIKCRDFIDQTTGIQTIVQMQGLRAMVLEEGYIAEAELKTAAEYKAYYLDQLMVSVDDRMQRLKRGERSLADFTLLGAPELLNALVEKKVILNMASGTDEKDVQIEAKALGYANQFDGGIHGSKGNEIGDAKKIVISRIVQQDGCQGGNLVVIGDGPVELLEGRRVGALCIGIASDEVRRHGMDFSKRTRLIKAGAHIIVPDFSQLDQLIQLIFKD